MENAADALKIAFAIFIFVLAITLTFSIISQAKSTADAVLYHADETNFYEYEYSDKNRVVSVTEVISSLYRYYKESLAVTVILNGVEDKEFDLAKTSLTIDKVEQELAVYIKDTLLKNYKTAKFKEEFVEVPFSGIYQTGEDGTQVIEASGGKKLYITYTYIDPSIEE